ncbi:ARM repeat-containing protein [Massarina eburnea CBS 473.64]|uniref:ARM repeat-containing protein n=1 Tax=Massarina eburnea CBS 473.64 TaxID=1395130 RepID=A0A6A6SFD3_9PLEO|nr:ARM repeat-containing protein [Massarina eburnea CBS 473.64]
MHMCTSWSFLRRQAFWSGPDANLERIPLTPRRGTKSGRGGERRAAVSIDTWQEPFRDSGILEYVLQSIDVSTIPASVAKQHLRVIGNSVVDNDGIREIVMEYLNKLVACLAVEELTMTALVVLHNLGNDFEPAHLKAAQSRLDNTLAEYFVAGKISEEATEYAMDLLTWTTEKLAPAQLEDNTSVSVFNSILQVTTQCDEDQQEEYLAILVHYLQDAEFQQKVATPDTIERLIDLMFAFESRLTPEEIEGVFQELNTHADPNNVVSEDPGVILMVRLVNSISAISASDAFVRTFTLRNPVVEKVIPKLTSPSPSPSTVCACVILGNLATSDEVCIEMVETMRLHLPLITMLSSPTEQAILYAAAGFTRHLAFPPTNRTLLGQAGLIPPTMHLLTHPSSTIRGEAAAILHKLVTNNLPNIQTIITTPLPPTIPLSTLPNTPSPPPPPPPPHPSFLQLIVTQALTPASPLPSTTMKNPMIELSRTLISILRYTRHPATEPPVVENLSHAIFSTPAIARPVARLVRQRFYADARSEGLLGLGLMAQSVDGAVCVVRELESDTALLGAIKEFAVEQREVEVGKSQVGAGGGVASSEGRDWGNAVVLLHGLVDHGIDAMGAELRREVEVLQAELGRLGV